MLELNVFYYDENYYLFPGDAPDIPRVRLKLALTGGRMPVRMLSGEECFPPWFPDNAVKDAILEADPDSFFIPARVNILSRDEYDSLLREKLRTQCKDCYRFVNDTRSISESYSETPPVEPCREKLTRAQFESYAGLQSGYEPSFSVDDFWNAFMAMSQELIARINHGDMAGATVRVMDALSDSGFADYLFPALSRYSFLDDHGQFVHRYVLMLTGAGFLCADMVASCFIGAAPDAVRKNWDIYPCAPRGLYHFWPELADWKIKDTPPILRVTYLEQHDRFQVLMFVRWDPDEAQALIPEELAGSTPVSEEEIPGLVFCVNYLYLCGIIGEERLRGACLDITAVPASELVYDGSTVTAEEFDAMIDDQIRDKSRFTVEKPLAPLELEGTSELRDVDYVETRSDQLTLDFLLGGDYSSAYMWDRSIPTACIRLNKALDARERTHFKRAIRKMLEDKGFAQLIDVCTGPDSTYLDLLVWDKFLTARALDRNSALFRFYGGQYTIKLGDDVREYKI